MDELKKKRIEKKNRNGEIGTHRMVALEILENDKLNINIPVSDNNSNVQYDSEKKTLTIDVSKELKYTVYLYEVEKENEVYPEIMKESELLDLQHRIDFKLTNKRIQSKEKFIEE